MRPFPFLTALLTACFFMSCNPYRPVPRAGWPAEYTTSWQEIYGRCYDSVPYAVVALDLYSEELELDPTHRMQGTGYNLYISDIFVPDSLLVPGEYHSLLPQSPPATCTFLLGRDWDGTPTGIYLLYIEEGKLQSVQVLDSGTFTVRDTASLTDISFTFYYRNAYGNKATYTTRFQGPLLPWLKH